MRVVPAQPGSVMTNRFIGAAILSLLCVTATFTASADSLVKGRIYLKDGSVVECGEKDRIRLPKRHGDIKLFRNAFYRDKNREIYPQEEVDSLVCWHKSEPERVRKFITSEKEGLLWVYFETPYICVCIYSSKGYGISANGGIEIWQRIRYFSQSRTAYYMRKSGDSEFHVAGSVNRNNKRVFLKRIAEYISDDAALAERILNSESDRNRTILMLSDYMPKGN